jgi:hypothetical protein
MDNSVKQIIYIHIINLLIFRFIYIYIYICNLNNFKGKKIIIKWYSSLKLVESFTRFPLIKYAHRKEN